MNSIATRDTPLVLLILVDNGVTTLEVLRIKQERVVFGLDVVAADLLLNDFTAPILVKPGVFNLLDVRGSSKQGVGFTDDIEVDLVVDDVVVEVAH